MGGISNVGAANGSGPAAKTHAHGKVAGANGGGDKAKGGGDATQVGGAADAAKGATQVSGGGGTSLSAALDALAAAVKSLAEAVQKMQVSGGGGGGGCGMGGQVAGVQGSGATKQQFVAKASNVSRSAAKEDDNFEQRVLELINQERAKAGLAPVSYNATLDNAAEKHASHMSIVGKMAHDGIGDGDPGERARAEGWRRAWGENVATGQTSPEQVVREWMNSPTHRRNIMDPNFRNMGVGQVTSANGRSYWAQEFGA